MISNNRMLLVFLLAIMNFTHIVDSMLIMPLGDVFIQEFQLSAAQYSYLVSGYALAAMISGILGIFLLDRFSRKKSILFIYIGFTISTILCGLTNGYASLLSLRVITGFFGGIIGAMVLSVITDLFKFEERGKAIGYVFASFSAASALGVPIGIYLADLSSWKLPFLIIGGLGIPIGLIIYFIFPNLDDHLELQDAKLNIRKTINKIISDKNQIIALTAGFVLVMAHFMIIPFISPFLMRNVGLTQSDIAMQFFLGGVATIFTGPYIGRLTDKFGVMKVFITLMLLSIIPTMLITTLTKAPVYQSLIYTTLFFILASGRMISPNTIITAAAPQNNRGSFMSLKSSLQQLAIALSGIISGSIIFINDDGYYQNYIYVGFLSVFIGLFAIYWVNKIDVAKGN